MDKLASRSDEEIIKSIHTFMMILNKKTADLPPLARDILSKDYRELLKKATSMVARNHLDYNSRFDLAVIKGDIEEMNRLMPKKIDRVITQYLSDPLEGFDKAKEMMIQSMILAIDSGNLDTVKFLYNFPGTPSYFKIRDNSKIDIIIPHISIINTWMINRVDYFKYALKQKQSKIALFFIKPRKYAMGDVRDYPLHVLINIQELYKLAVMARDNGYLDIYRILADYYNEGIINILEDGEPEDDIDFINNAPPLE